MIHVICKYTPLFISFFFIHSVLLRDLFLKREKKKKAPKYEKVESFFVAEKFLFSGEKFFSSKRNADRHYDIEKKNL